MEGLLSENLSSNDLKSENKREKEKERDRRETTNILIGEKGKCKKKKLLIRTHIAIIIQSYYAYELNFWNY